MKPLPRREVIRKLRGLGFAGPVQSGRHPYMHRGRQKVHIPGEHARDVPIWLQMKMLEQAGIDKEDWEKA